MVGLLRNTLARSPRRPNGGREPLLEDDGGGGTQLRPVQPRTPFAQVMEVDSGVESSDEGEDGVDDQAGVGGGAHGGLLWWLGRERDHAQLDSATLRDQGSMPGWGGAWGGGDGSKEHESLDFDTINTPFWVDSSRQPQKRGFMLNFSDAIVRSKRLYQWLFTVAIGVGVALVAQLVMATTALLIKTRNSHMQRYYDAGRPDTDVFVFFASYNAVLVAIAGVLAVLAGPSAAGDGVAEVKAYLNGSHIHGCFHMRAMLNKVVGTILVNSAALASGPEGPMIHMGAGVAYAVTSIDSLSAVFPSITPSILARFTNDRDRREFIAAGAGAGIAAAFGAPIGGVLFALEEAASHWSPQLIWRIFTSSMLATFILALIRAGGNSGDISLAGLLSSGTKISLTQSKGGVMESDGSSIVSVMDAPVYAWELMLFVILGALGGVLGGLFNASYNMLAPLRSTSKVMRVLQVLFLSLGTSYTVFFLADMFPRCSDNGSFTCRDADNWGDRCSGFADNSTCVGMRAQCVNATGWVCSGGGNNGLACHGRSGFEDCQWRGGSCVAVQSPDSVFGVRSKCDVGQYDELATLFFGDKSSSIIRMVTQSAPSQDAPFSNQSLLIAAAAYQVLMMATYGAPVAAGFFMPCWLIGAALGRLFGQLVNAHLQSDEPVYSGAYALAGAAAMLGGVQRASISLIFFIIEGTSNVHFLLPIVTTLLAANVVSNFFAKEGVLDLALRYNGLRFLPHKPDWLMELCVVADVSGGPVRSLRTIESIGNIVDLLRSCHHNGFPVVALTDSPQDASPSASAHVAAETSRLPSWFARPVDFEGSFAATRGSGGDGSTACDESEGAPQEENECGWNARKGRNEKGRLEGIILRSHLRHILGARFMRDGGTPNSLWQRVTFPASAWPPAATDGASPGGDGRGQVPLVGDPEMYDLIEYRRRRVEVATVKEWEWGMFCEEDRSRLVNLAAYMNAACYSVHQVVPADTICVRCVYRNRE